MDRPLHPLRDTMLVTEAGRGIWSIENVTLHDVLLLVNALDVFLDQAGYGENTPATTLGELRDDLEEAGALWELQAAAERQTILDAKQRLKKKKSAAAGK